MQAAVAHKEKMPNSGYEIAVAFKLQSCSKVD